MLDSLGRNNRKIPDKKCESCNNIFRPVDSKKRTCSRECGYKIRKCNPVLKNNGKGWVNKKGYHCIKIDGKEKKVHRLIKENELGRKLLPSEDIHHNDRNKLNNSPDNLIVIDHAEHTKITNDRIYKKGYKLNLTNAERKRRSDSMKLIRKKATE